jgi:hypothetical protein
MPTAAPRLQCGAASNGSVGILELWEVARVPYTPKKKKKLFEYLDESPLQRALEN